MRMGNLSVCPMLVCTASGGCPFAVCWCATRHVRVPQPYASVHTEGEYIPSPMLLYTRGRNLSLCCVLMCTRAGKPSLYPMMLCTSKGNWLFALCWCAQGSGTCPPLATGTPESPLSKKGLEGIETPQGGMVQVRHNSQAADKTKFP